jgi:two-component system cell cycle sensor histidine kinase/response regulator CckA
MLLVVDDEEPLRRTVSRMLTNAGFRVVSASSGQRALDVLEQTSIRLLVTDLKMPGMNGRELAERVRQRKPQLPILFISGYPSPRTTEALPGPILIKPFTEEELVRQVDRLLQAPA